MTSKPWKRTTLYLPNTSANKMLKNYQLFPLSKFSASMCSKHTMGLALIFTIKSFPKWRTSWRSSLAVESWSSILGAETDNTANTFLRECFIWVFSNAGRWLLLKMEHIWTASHWHSEIVLLIECSSLLSYTTSLPIKPDWELSLKLRECWHKEAFFTLLCFHMKLKKMCIRALKPFWNTAYPQAK